MNALLRRLFTVETIAGLRLSALGWWWAERAARRLEKVSGRKSHHATGDDA